MIPLFRGCRGSVNVREHVACSRLSLSGSQPLLVGTEPEQEPRWLELLILIQCELLDVRCSCSPPLAWGECWHQMPAPLVCSGPDLPTSTRGLMGNPWLILQILDLAVWAVGSHVDLPDI